VWDRLALDNAFSGRLAAMKMLRNSWDDTFEERRELTPVEQQSAREEEYEE
jgi:hypothetical protein